ncbi:DUF3298 and DUF4163 domain-containing protein [Lawsonia intracellularis]|uniref:DUF3298 and DUF4163 domain-containing protein n=1 Tax=Lawsonia intracellularis TaxID=29546 RepID=UPI001CBECAF2|nr:DUF3298 and DUF4163 domain-containing protein [Lawsonia intracellularis]MBZ3892366.1 DUF3298 and DUF4163 domain-containing protein [Lawsonia intracellularis]UYH53118.1 DUF3298 and DUF4163 domain-containing protein [Lawsonia intracellularis]
MRYINYYYYYYYYFLFFFIIITQTICFAHNTDGSSILDHSITITTKEMQVSVHYPEIHSSKIDQDIKGWAQQLVENFKTTNSEKELAIGPYELRADYSITKPSDKAISIIYTITDFTGGAHGNLEISVFNYDLTTEQPLDLIDIFDDVNSALKIMSEYSYKSLSETLGNMSDKEILSVGTAPDLDNYNSIALIPNGIRIFFQPYQVAPWSAGPQQVDMTLEELSKANPTKKIWNLS